MQKPFGYTLHISLSLSKSWLSLGPGWAALAGAISSGYFDLTQTGLIQLISLWILVDPLLGTLWELAVQQGILRQIWQAQLPLPARGGFYLPYAQPESVAGRWVLTVRRYRRWWRERYWPELGDKFITFWLAAALVLLLGYILHPTIFWLAVFATGLILLIGPALLESKSGGRWQSVVQFLLPWLMGVLLAPAVLLPPLALGFCYWVIYLGGLRMLGHHHRAEYLYFGGQLAAVVLLLSLQLLPAAALIAVFFVAQFVIKSQDNSPDSLLRKSQILLVIGLAVAAFFLGQ